MQQQLSGVKPHLHVSIDLAKAADRTPVQQTMTVAVGQIGADCAESRSFSATAAGLNGSHNLDADSIESNVCCCAPEGC